MLCHLVKYVEKVSAMVFKAKITYGLIDDGRHVAELGEGKQVNKGRWKHADRVKQDLKWSRIKRGKSLIICINTNIHEIELKNKEKNDFATF